MTCRWWNDTWLNEALGTWADGKITDALEPAWKFTLGRDVGAMARAMDADGQPTAQKIRLPVETKDAIQNSFDDDITYFKGHVGAAHDRALGRANAKFLDAIRTYLGAHAWGNADADEFIAGAARGAGRAGGGGDAVVRRSAGRADRVGERCAATAGAGVLLSQKRFFNAGDRPSDAHVAHAGVHEVGRRARAARCSTRRPRRWRCRAARAG